MGLRKNSISMNRTIRVFLIAGLGVGLPVLSINNFGVYAEQNNPFKDKLPKAESSSSLPGNKGQSLAPDILGTIELQGIIWGTGVSQAIISGEIYREGDVIGTLGIRVSHIYNDKVALIYLNKEYYLTIQKKGDEQDDNQE